MHTIAIIGAGQLGSRHLQGLATAAIPLSIHLLDPSPASLEVARARFAEVAGSAAPHRLHLATDVAQMPANIDLLISATTAGVRLPSLGALLGRCKVTNLILEKVLFQTLAEYDEAAALLREHGISAWVNCPRRMFPIYSTLKDFFGDEGPTYMNVSGANWGLGCNGVHFTDLFAFLTGDSDLTYDAALLDQVVHPSKRAGFFEFSGTLAGRNTRRQVALQASTEGNARHLIVLRSASKIAVVDETGGVARLLAEGGEWGEQRFNVLYQSQLTGPIAMDILAGKAPSLPDYETSARIHTAFIAPLLAHYNRITGANAAACPIT
jgi:hypothetical protein